MLDHLFRRVSEVGIVRRHVAAAAKPDAGRFPDRLVAGDVKQRAVDGIEMLRHFLEHQHMTGQVRYELGADQVAEDGDVEGGRRMLAVDGSLKRLGRAIDQEGERAFDRLFAAVALDVVRNRSVRCAKSVAIETREEKRAIAVAEYSLFRAASVNPASTYSAMRPEP